MLSFHAFYWQNSVFLCVCISYFVVERVTKVGLFSWRSFVFVNICFGRFFGPLSSDMRQKKHCQHTNIVLIFFVTELSSLTCAKYENVNTLQNRKTLTRCRTSHLTRTQNIFYIAVLNVGVFLSGHTSKPQYALPGFPFFFFFWPARGPES